MKGTTVSIVVKTQTGTDAFGAPIYEETTEAVADVLVGQPTSQEVTDAMNLHGKMVAFVLGIPKGDTHVWEDTTVIIWGNKYRTIGSPTTGEQANIPLRWGQNVKVERYVDAS